MNIVILQKILTELGKETPSIDYMKGMVETLIEMGGSPLPTYAKNYKLPETMPVIRTESVSDEDNIPNFLKPGPTGNVN